MCPPTLRALAALVLCSCAPSDDEPTQYPSPEVAASCVTSPTLCGLALHDLGGGDHPNAFHIVLIGDGYLDDEQGLFEWHANSLASIMQNPDGLFASNDLVERAPELFHFWRVDVPSDSIEVDNQTLTDTPLGAHLGPPDNCVGNPFIRAIEDRFAVALDNAVVVPIDDDVATARWRFGPTDQGSGDLRAGEVSAWPGEPVTSSRATFVLLSHRSSGRANATPEGNVRMSSSDSADTMAHELGHALFHLGDEYTEFSSCEPSPLPFTCGPPADISEVGLLDRANTSTLHDGSKWSNDVDGSEPGGNRWPCHAHPTESCLMLHSAGPLCPACASAVAERFARRRCLGDTRPPRVAIEPDPAIFASGTRALVAASAFDERAFGSQSLGLAWTVDGVPLPDVTGPFAVLDLTAIAGREVRATASDGRFTQASSPVALPAKSDGDEPADVELPALGPLRVASTFASSLDGMGNLVQIVRGVGARVAIGVRPLACTNVVRAGITLRRDGGPLKTKDISLPGPARVGCQGTPSTLFLELETTVDAGAEIEVIGFIVDGKNRRAESAAWRPVRVDDTTCDLDVNATRADGGALSHSASDDSDDSEVLGSFDAIVVDVPESIVDVYVRLAHKLVSTLLRGAVPASGVVVMPIGLPAATGKELDVDVLGVCGLGGDEVAWIAASTRIAVRWDNEPPAIAVQTSLAPFADAMEMAVIDDSTIESVTVTRRPVDGGAPIPPSLVLTEPPWRVSPPVTGPLTITATDVVGNKTTRDVDVTQQVPLDRDITCPVGGAP